MPIFVFKEGNHDMPLKIVRNDITKMKVDAIVNTVNPEPSVGGGTDYAVCTAAGSDILAARRKVGVIPIGEARLTLGYRLPARYVIHAVTPAWRDGLHGEGDMLAQTYHSALELATSHRLKSVAFPLIGSGAMGFPKADALTIATDTIRDFLDATDRDLTVYLVVFDSDSFRLSGALYDDVASYIDDHYAKEALDAEYAIDELTNEFNNEAEPCTDESPSIPEPLAPQWINPRKRDHKLDDELDSKTVEESVCAPCVENVEAPLGNDSLQARLSHIGDTFTERLLHLIDNRNLKDSDIYKRANIDRRLFSKIRGNKYYKPSKDTVLALSIALRLNLDETRDFLATAGFALSPSSHRDIIVSYFIDNGKYDIIHVNEVLYDYHLDTLN